MGYQQIDGSKHEGGGQLVRVALVLSAITGQPAHIHNIRAGRAPSRQQLKSQKPGNKGGKTRSAPAPIGGGLKESHLRALEWLAERCNADVDGATEGSQSVRFKPRTLKSARRAATDEAFVIALEKPGSVWLVFQAILPYMIFNGRHQCHHEPSEPIWDVTLHGGTNVYGSMSGEYVKQVFLPVCRKIGLPRLEIDIRKHRFNVPGEQGDVNIKVYASEQRESGDSLDGQAHTRDGSTHSSMSSTPTEATFILPAFRIADRGSVIRLYITVLSGLASTNSDAIVAKTIESIQAHVHITTLGQQQQPEVIVHPDTSNIDAIGQLYILLVAETSRGWRLGSDYLHSGKRFKTVREEQIMVDAACKTTVQDLSTELERGGCVDRHLADQLIIFQALAVGKSFVQTHEGPSPSLLELQDSADSVHRSGGSLDGQGESTEHDGLVDEDTIKIEQQSQLKSRQVTLHNTTVRWLCEEMLTDHGFRFDWDTGICSGIGWNRVRTAS